MVDFLSEIYADAMLVTEVKELVEKLRAENYTDFAERWGKLIEALTDFCKRAMSREDSRGSEVFARLNKAVQCVKRPVPDMKAFTDELSDAVPVMYEVMRSFGDIDVTEGDLRLFSSRSGYLSIQNVNSRRLYHSATDPMWEARNIALRIYDPSKTTYYFLGSGLGYLPYYIYRLSDESADIAIFHNDPIMIGYAKQYGVLDLIPDNKLRIVTEKNEEKLIKAFAKDAENDDIAYYCMSDVTGSLSDEYSDRVAKFAIVNATHTVFKDSLLVNTYRNLKNVEKNVTDYVPKSDEWIVVAAGPSLDDHIDHITENRDRCNVLCVGTVFRKLLKLGIRPDCVAVVDPQPRTWNQFEGLEKENVPVFINISANWRFSERYEGEKYLVPGLSLVNIDNRFSEQWVTGGTVTTFAVEIAAKLGAKRIDLLGVDLAYPSGRTHAEGTMDNKTVSADGMIPVKSVSGDKVYTTNQFKTYIDDLSAKTSEYRNIKFVNYSDGGAAIDNTVWYKSIKPE